MIRQRTDSSFLRASIVAASVALGTLAVACGGEAPAPASPPSAPPAASAVAAGSATPAALPTAWSDDMPMDQKKAFMKANVAPRMAKVFQGMNATHFADFGCKTCHGPDWKAPKDFLPKLSMKDGKITAFADKPEVAKFMAEKVVPEMASALGEKPYDAATKSGFGCMGCHSIETK
jgi:cytochrome c551/c552